MEGDSSAGGECDEWGAGGGGYCLVCSLPFSLFVFGFALKGARGRAGDDDVWAWGI